QLDRSHWIARTMGKVGRKVAARAAEGKASTMAEEEGLVVLRSQDGMDFLVPAEEARLSMFVHRRIELDRDNHMVPADGDETKYTPILLRSIRGDVLSKVLEYCRKHASGDDDPAWDANFASLLDQETLCDLILAAHSLCNPGLLALTCQAVANMVKGKSVDETYKLFNLGQGRALTREQNALKARHVVRCQEFTAYDPKRRDLICTRLSHDYYNIAFFDHDQESRIARGPPLGSIAGSILDWGVRSSLNIILLKVSESEVGYPFSVFGTVIARDEVDYKCLYLFRREKKDAQIIKSMDDMLILTDPPRGLVLLDEVFFEIDLKIERDGGATMDFSKGVISLIRARLPVDRQTMTVNLCSWLSSVDVLCEHVEQPVEATVGITSLKGPCNLGGVCVWADGNYEERIILYSSDSCLAVGGPVPLARRVVAVPMGKKLVIRLRGLTDESDYVAGLTKEGEEGEDVVITMGPSDEGSCVCSMGWGEVQVQVAWTGILKREEYKMDVVGDVSLLR
uniref:SKP1 component POZ domain-containing protein n=6 Tax=Triticinae TaxID=1648030 RepID=A0A453G6C8_AEGTS